MKRMQWLCACLLLGMTLSLVAIGSPNASQNYTVSSYTRETDYTIGSIVRQGLEVVVPRGYRLDPASFPEKAQIDAVELRDVNLDFSDEKTQTRYKIMIEWQVFLAAESVKSVPLKPLSLVFKRDGQILTVPVPADKILISNLLPAQMDAVHVRPYDDVAPQLIPLQPILLTLVASLGLCLACIVYLAWYFGWIKLKRDAVLPFRQAWLEIRALPQAPESVAAAMVLLSRAFDRHLGHSLSAEQLGVIVTDHARLATHAEAIRNFFADVQATFFAGQPPLHDLKRLEKLARKLSQLELS